jgi:hypothetical protein
MKKILTILSCMLLSCSSVLACGCPFAPTVGFSRGPGINYGFGNMGCRDRVFAWGDTYTSAVNVWLYVGPLVVFIAIGIVIKRWRSSIQALQSVCSESTKNPQIENRADRSGAP